MGDDGEASLTCVGRDEVLSANDDSFSMIGEGDRAKGGTLDASNAGLCACNTVWSGVRPVPSTPPETFLAEAPDSIELKLDVLLCGEDCAAGPPPKLLFLCSTPLGGKIEMVFGRSTFCCRGGRIICEAPFRYDKWKLVGSFPGEGGLNAGAAWKNCGGAFMAVGEGSGNDGTGGMSSSARPSARKNWLFFDFVDTLDSGGDGWLVGLEVSSCWPLA